MVQSLRYPWTALKRKASADAEEALNKSAPINRELIFLAGRGVFDDLMLEENQITPGVPVPPFIRSIKAKLRAKRPIKPAEQVRLTV
jgi:hypothetical protein